MMGQGLVMLKIKKKKKKKNSFLHMRANMIIEKECYR